MFKRIPCVVWAAKPDDEHSIVVLACTSSYRQAKRVQRMFQEIRIDVYVGISEIWHHPELGPPSRPL